MALGSGWPVLLGLAGGGTAWVLHLSAGYFMVSIGCARGWPALGLALAMTTAACAMGALAVAVMAWRARGRTRGAEASRFLLGVGASLNILFAIMIVLGGLTVVVLPACRA
jgi:hypothetical protein